MKIERAEISACRYELKRVLDTSRTRLSERCGYALELIDEDGRIGRGESLPLPVAGTEDLQETGRALRAVTARLLGREGELAELLDWVDEWAPTAPAARFSLDSALHDLEAQRRGLPLARLLAAHPSGSVAVNEVLGLGNPQHTAEAAAAAVALGYRTLKLKVGAAPPEVDAVLLASVRDAVPRVIALRLDANGAWSVREALVALERLSEFDVELVEQPVPARDLAGLRYVAERSPIPVAADEALAHEAGREALLGGELAPVAILKPMVLGGVRASARLAAASGVRCVVTTTFEGPVGVAAALHLAAAVGDRKLAHGLAASDALVADFPAQLAPISGSLSPARGPGLMGTAPG